MIFFNNYQVLISLVVSYNTLILLAYEEVAVLV